MRKWLLYIFLVFGLAFFKAEAAETAQSVLKHVVEKMKQGMVEADFDVNASGVNGTGHLLLSGNKFAVTTDDLSTWYDGKTQWTYSKNVKEVTVTTPTVDELAEINPLVVLSGLSSKFNAEMSTAAASGVYEIVLVAKASDSQISSARIAVDSRTWFPNRVEIITATGQKFTIVIKVIKNVKSVPESAFKFNRQAYPGVEVIDLR